MNKYFIFLTLFVTLGLYSCDTQFSKYKVHEKPQNQADYRLAVLQALDEVIEDHPDNPDAYYQKAQFILPSGNYDEALTLVNQALALNSRKSEYYELLAEIQFRQGQVEEAELHARKALDLAESRGENAARSYALLSEIAFKHGDFDQSFDYINQAIALAPHEGMNYYRKGMIYLQTGDTLSGKVQIEKALDDPEMDPEMYSNLIVIYQNEGNFDKALSLLDKQSKAMPGSNLPLFRKASLYTEMRKFDEASAILHGMIREDSATVQAYYQLAILKFTIGQSDSAMYYADRTLAFDSNNPEAMLLKGRVYDKWRRYQMAANQFEQILQIDPGNKLAEQELRKVKRKIAYLRKIEEEKQRQAQDSIPVIQPLKSKQIESQED